MGAGVLLGLALAAAMGLPATQQAESAVELAEGDPAPFSGVLITEERFRRIAQEALRAESMAEEIKLWERGHKRAIEQMEKAQAQLAKLATECRPKPSTFETITRYLSTTIVLAVPLLCTGKKDIIVIDGEPQ